MDEPQALPQPSQQPKRRSITGGLVLIVLGILFLLNNFLPDFHIGDYWPLILIAIGIAVLFRGRRHT